MKSCVAIITYNRLACLKAALACFKNQEVPVGVFEDEGWEDGTREFLSIGDPGSWDDELKATRHSGLRKNVEAYLSKMNAGVAGNSNRAIRWFMRSPCDHLVLCHDDLLINDSLVGLYREAHLKTGIGLFCWDNRDTTGEVRSSYNGVSLRAVNGAGGKILSLTRKVVDAIGYFDTSFGKFGEEGGDYNIRARVAGFLKVEGKDLRCVDIVHDHAKTQDAPSSVGENRARLLVEAEQVMQKNISSYAYTSPYRPFMLHKGPEFIGPAGGKGISTKNLSVYARVAPQEAIPPSLWE